mmetsp:Transcript_12043/g.24450  ORF Transcript_12043/g.24450 Transcript_12043/m.24450 type:complete len:432 (-) Transcript_12043:285-1580(-)
MIHYDFIHSFLKATTTATNTPPRSAKPLSPHEYALAPSSPLSQHCFSVSPSPKAPILSISQCHSYQTHPYRRDRPLPSKTNHCHHHHTTVLQQQTLHQLLRTSNIVHIIPLGMIRPHRHAPQPLQRQPRQSSAKPIRRQNRSAESTRGDQFHREGGSFGKSKEVSFSRGEAYSGGSWRGGGGDRIGDIYIDNIDKRVMFDPTVAKPREERENVCAGIVVETSFVFPDVGGHDDEIVGEGGGGLVGGEEVGREVDVISGRVVVVGGGERRGVGGGGPLSEFVKGRMAISTRSVEYQQEGQSFDGGWIRPSIGGRWNVGHGGIAIGISNFDDFSSDDGRRRRAIVVVNEGGRRHCQSGTAGHAEHRLQQRSPTKGRGRGRGVIHSTAIHVILTWLFGATIRKATIANVVSVVAFRVSTNDSKTAFVARFPLIP